MDDSTPGDRAAVTLVVPAFNNWHYSKLLLDGLRRYSGWPHRVLFVDNGSTDGTAKGLLEYPEVEVIRNPENLGFAAAVNRTLPRIETDLFAILNNDIYPSPGWLETWVAAFRSDPGCWQLTARSNCNIDGPTALRDVSFPSWIEFRDARPGADPARMIEEYYRGEYDRFSREVTAGAGSTIEEVEAPPGWMAGWAVLMRTSIVEALGGQLFDERFEIGFCEDMDLSWRVAREGGKIGVARGVYIHHFINATFDILDVDKHVIARRNYRLLVDKWEPVIREQCHLLTGGDPDRLEELVARNEDWRKCAEYLGMKSLLSPPGR